MSELVNYSDDYNVAFITIENPPVNALSPGVPEGIEEGLRQALADDSIRAVVIIGGGRTFVAGADIRELEKVARGDHARSPKLKELLVEIEDSPKPVIAAIHGNALGGGLELAMACHYRIASPGTKVGQPEVKLGIIPGAAGTQRLPRLVGLAKAAEMCAVGDPISVDDAHALGLIDAIVEGDLKEGAIQFAGDVVQKTPPKTRERQDKLVPQTGQADQLADLRKRFESRKEMVPAPVAAIDAVEITATTTFEAGCQREGELFEACIRSPAAQALMHVFFGEREVAKIPDMPITTPVHDIKRVAVLGAGTMGSGIATAYAAANLPVLLQDEEPAGLERGLAAVAHNLGRMATRRGWSPEELKRRVNLVQATRDFAGFDAVDLIVEAVFEGMQLKKEVFAKLDGIARKGCILATNTSTLSVDEIASATSRPSWVVGHHFFSPAHVMRLLEIVRGKETAGDVLATSMALAKKLGKVGVMVGNCRGFVGNRMYGPYQREAQFLVEEGATPEQVDRVMEAFGMAMGPLAVGDLSGLDVGWRVRKESAHLVPQGWRQPVISDRLCEMGRFGQKTGRGWYLYEKENRQRKTDPELPALLDTVARENGIARRAVGDEEIRDRLLLALIVEGARILEEGFALRPVDIDIIYVYGYGFPAYQGGPMFYADRWGLDKVCRQADELAASEGPWWRPPGLLVELAEKGGTFRGWKR
jgi:3-hydroxyacyl-CoA dehydrogenase